MFHLILHLIKIFKQQQQITNQNGSLKFIILTRKNSILDLILNEYLFNDTLEIALN